MVKISVIIPTLQKKLSFLINLLSTLERDTSVDEIIVIDNSLRGLNYKSSKLRLIIPEENLFVNPSWNLGVKEAKNELVALLNDDIIIPDGFCSRIAEKMNALRGGGGCVGFCGDNIIVTKDLVPQPEQTSIELTATDTRCLYWGMVIFFYKTSYYEIPEELKIYCGDDWIFIQNQRHKKQNCNICGQNIYHYQSLSSKGKDLNPICRRDIKLYRRLVYKWYQNILHIEHVYNGVCVTLFGFKILVHFSKNH